MGDMSEVTLMLEQIQLGDSHAAEQLLPLIYEELRKLARHLFASEKPDHTLQATALVHEAYVRLVSASPSNAEIGWQSRGHFFGAAAEAMRRILVEKARRRKRLKHGGEHRRVDLEMALSVADPPDFDLLGLDEALTRLEETDPLAANVVKLRYFAGLTMPETAEALGVSLRHAERNWTYAKAWLHRELSGDS
jgi:RNA polymerase sigma factor (TIGR02999 family)